MREKFLQLVNENISRYGINDLLNFLEQSDFYYAPASTRFHGNYEGGLVEHSCNVYNQLIKLNLLYQLCDNNETLAIISLFHDLCKIGCYKQDFRNVKNEKGVWEKVPCYTFEEQFNFGYHGPKSVYLINKFIELTDEESVCIATHMGAYDRPNGDYSISNAFEQFPLALLLHTSDMLATCIDEKK